MPSGLTSFSYRMAKNNSASSFLILTSRFTTVVSIALVLFLIGCLCLACLLGQSLASFVKENMTFSVILKDNARENEIKKTKKDLEAYPFIKSVSYITKEQALADLSQELGADPTDLLGFNPLQPSLEVCLLADYANADSLPRIEKILTSFPAASELTYRQDLLYLVEEKMLRFSQIMLLAVGVMLGGAFLLINNTIRLFIHSKRFLIYTMRLVGATNGFIRRPILFWHVKSGIVAALLACLAMKGTLVYFGYEQTGLEEVLTTEMELMVYGGMGVMGIVIPYLAAFVATNRFLRMKGDSMYKD